MFRYFRRIRFNLLAHDKFRNYALYALGEILLIVSGILIAITLNNLNTRAKERQAEVQFLHDIQEDLQKTMKDLNWDLERHTFRLVRTDKILNNLIFSQGYQDSLFHNLPDLARDFQLYPKMGAFESLKSVGLSLISNDNLRQQITDLHQLEIERIFSKGTRQTPSLSIQNLMTPFLEKHFTLSGKSHLADLPELREDLELMPEVSYFEYQLVSYEALKEDQSFLVMLQTVQINRRNKIFDHLIAKREIEKTIRLIDRELDRLD